MWQSLFNARLMYVQAASRSSEPVLGLEAADTCKQSPTPDIDPDTGISSLVLSDL